MKDKSLKRNRTQRMEPAILIGKGRLQKRHALVYERQTTIAPRSTTRARMPRTSNHLTAAPFTGNYNLPIPYKSAKEPNRSSGWLQPHRKRRYAKPLRPLGKGAKRTSTRQSDTK